MGTLIWSLIKSCVNRGLSLRAHPDPLYQLGMHSYPPHPYSARNVCTLVFPSGPAPKPLWRRLESFNSVHPSTLVLCSSHTGVARVYSLEVQWPSSCFQLGHTFEFILQSPSWDSVVSGTFNLNYSTVAKLLPLFYSVSFIFFLCLPVNSSCIYHNL